MSVVVVAVSLHDQMTVGRSAGTRTLGLDGVLLRAARYRHGDHTLLHEGAPVPAKRAHTDINLPRPVKKHFKIIAVFVISAAHRQHQAANK